MDIDKDVDTGLKTATSPFGYNLFLLAIGHKYDKQVVKYTFGFSTVQ